MIIDFNKYNGGGSGSGVTPEQVQEQINSALTPYWDSAVTVDYVDGAVSGIDLSNYYTKVETDSAITAVENHLFDVEEVTSSALTELHDGLLEVSAATGGKADAANVSGNTSNRYFPLWNEQGIITGTTGLNVSAGVQTINGVSKLVYGGQSDLGAIYAPTDAGTAGKVLVSKGSGAPVWSAVTIPDMSLYTPTSGFSTINGSAITNGGNIVIEGGSGGDSTVLKGVSEFPRDAEIGDLVSKIIPIDGFYWDNSDNTTDKMHIDLAALDTGETYTIATFESVSGASRVTLFYDDEDLVWGLAVNEENGGVYLGGIIPLTGVSDCNIPLNEFYEYYASIGYLPDDYSGQGGMMIQIGLTNGSFGNWEGNVTDIRDYTDYDIEFAETKYAADGPYYYDGEDWVNIKEEAEKAAEDKVLGAFPRMPHFNLDGGGVDIEQVKSAIFDTYVPDGGEEPVNRSEMWLYNTAFDYLDNNVDWNDADVPIQFTIDPVEKVAYIENIPAGNYIFGLYKDEPGDKYDPEFNILYWSKSAADGLGDWDWQTIENTCAPWDNPDMEMNQYWRDKFDCNVAITNQVGWFNWSFPKDVKRFEIRIVDGGQGNEYLEINTEYKEGVTSVDDFGYGIVTKMVKLDQYQYDQLVLDDEVDPDTFYIIVPPSA